MTPRFSLASFSALFSLVLDLEDTLMALVLILLLLLLLWIRHSYRVSKNEAKQLEARIAELENRADAMTRIIANMGKLMGLK